MQTMSREGQVAAGPTQYQKRLKSGVCNKRMCLLSLSYNSRIECLGMHKYRDDI